MRSKRTRSLEGASILSSGRPHTGEAWEGGGFLVGELMIDGMVLRLHQALRRRPDQIIGATASEDAALGLDMATLGSGGCKGLVINDDIHDGLYRYATAVVDRYEREAS
jgi:hypothetical protein